MSGFIPDDTRIFKPSQIVDVLKEWNFASMLVSGGTMIDGQWTKIDYYNIPTAFDIETSSFYYDENGQQIDYEEKARRMVTNPTYNPTKVACMYVWQFGINGRVFIGRTWKEFLSLLRMLKKAMAITYERRLIIYVHNLSYETGFLQRVLSIKDMFALDTRDVLYFVTKSGFEFRCSFHLSQMSLKHVGEKKLLRYHVKKMVGDLDYNLIRHSLTPLTEKEIGYCVNDVKVVMNYIQEEIENNGGITKIPYTSTGYARHAYRDVTIHFPDTGKPNFRYKDLMRELTISSKVEYTLCNLAYMGGFTHANPYYIGKINSIVASYDLTSSYPAVMVMEKYPMGRGVQITIKDRKQYEAYAIHYCLVFRVRFLGLRATYFNDNYISSSQCVFDNQLGKDEKGKEVRPPIKANGRLVWTNEQTYTDMVITDVDFDIIQKTYTWDKIQFGTCFAYKRGYLPTEFVNCLLTLYEKKNTLKGVADKALEYMLSKAIVNASYGMAGENPVKDIITFDINNENGIWTTRKQTGDELIQTLENYNNKGNRFIFFPWAIFITAYARHNLWKGILALGDDYIYSDTDSLKFLHFSKHRGFFKSYRENIIKKLTQACQYHKIDLDKVCHKGKWLGDWDFEGVYPHFKTLGAKRYMVHSPSGYVWGKSRKKHEPILEVPNEDGAKTVYDISLTVSGVNKYDAIPWLVEKYNHNALEIFNAFDDGMEIPASYTGKLLHTYIDFTTGGTVIDYLGQEYRWEEKSSVHLEPTQYKISSLSMLFDYVRGLKQRQD